jgi:peptide/nickel transport system permease protein
LGTEGRRDNEHFQLKRTVGFFKTLFGNKMAAIGLVVLLGFVFAAVGAPLVSPYDPRTPVSGSFGPPAWMSYFPEGYYLSQNLLVVNDPLFNSPSAVQAWNVVPSASIQSSFSLSYARGVYDPGAQGSQGSMQLSHTGPGNGTVVVSKIFYYPYHGPPKKFFSLISFLASGATFSNPIHVSLFVDRGDQVFNFYDADLISSGSWSGQVGDSQDKVFQQHLGLSGLTTLDPASIIFSSQKDYTYGVQVTFHGAQTLNIDHFQLQLLGTSWGLLGTDYNGQDVFTWVIYGSRISLFVGLLSAFIGIGLGLLVGLLAGFLGKLVDEVLMRFTDMMLVIPVLPLLLVLVAVLGANLFNIIVVIGFLGWMGFARVIRSQVLTLKERPFIEAAKAAGSGPMRTMATHVFPNLVSLTYVNLALAVPSAILFEAALEFLGLGDPRVVSWGIMFFQADINGAISSWWWIIPPGLAIAAVSLSFVLIGYALDELFNPKLRRRR